MNDYPKRRSPRLREWDYRRPGAYFLTICTKNRIPSLCRIRRGAPCGRPQTEYTPLGRIALECLPKIEAAYGIRVDNYVLMPNHIHLIVTIPDTETRAPARGAPTISQIVGGYKSMIAVKWLDLCKRSGTRSGPLFQRSFHDHIIRNEADYRRIYDYIDQNPLKWELDCFYIP